MASEEREPVRRRKRMAEPAEPADDEYENKEPERREPVGPSDAAFSFCHNGEFYVCHCYSFSLEQIQMYLDYGYSEDQLLPLQRFNFCTAEWSGASPVCVARGKDGKRRRTRFAESCGVCCAVLGNSAYTFGGRWKYGYAVHELSLDTMLWRRIEPTNREDGPMLKEKAGMVALGDDTLCIFGGYGPVTHHHQPGATYHMDQLNTLPTCFTNELHLFHTRTGTWSSPETSGPRPPPCAWFSFTRVDLSRAVLFGGEQAQQPAVNELHILDLDSWHWSGSLLPSSPADRWPRERSLHSACSLFDSTQCAPSCDERADQVKPQLFVLFGQDSNRRKLRDAWILDVDSTMWKKVKLPLVMGRPHSNISLGCYNRSPTEAELVIFGGSCLTTLMYLGVKTLYHLCVNCIAEKHEIYPSMILQQFLPPHVCTDIHHERDRRANRAHYRVAQL